MLLQRSNIGLEEPFHYLAQQWFDRIQFGRESMFKGRSGTENQIADTSRPPKSSYQRRVM